VSAFSLAEKCKQTNLVFLHILECTIRNTFLTNINLGRLSDIASHCKKIHKYFIEITFLSHFCHVYPKTARVKIFAVLVKRHLAGFFLRLSPPDCVVLESLAVTVKSWVCLPTGSHCQKNKKIKRADQILPEVYGTTLKL
jgi:hypothetical protein